MWNLLNMGVLQRGDWKSQMAEASLRHVGTEALKSFGWTKEFGDRWEEDREEQNESKIYWAFAYWRKELSVYSIINTHNPVRKMLLFLLHK